MAADEVVSISRPRKNLLISNAEWDEMPLPFVTAGDMHVGRLARKAVYREYADSTFATKKPGRRVEAPGVVGPLLRGVVGDTIRVVFETDATYPASVHPHGGPTTQGLRGRAVCGRGWRRLPTGRRRVAQGGTHVYTWPVPERAGPSHAEGSTAFWMYHSHTHEVDDINAGLIGPIIVTARGQAPADATPTDVDRELVVGFLEFDENKSALWRRTCRLRRSRPRCCKPDLLLRRSARCCRNRSTASRNR